ncbi:MAG: YbfB/YjiJ family MFS transporter [Alphaproteobacteria bacterium]|nr:YbfB/YjiJ family MFS transporter [Alphaproteobacteria bacterium]
MAAAMGLGRFVFTPLLPDLMVGMQLSPTDAGLIASANYVGYLVGAVLAGYGWAAGRERAMFVWALISTTVLLALVPMAGGVASLSVIRFAAGVASAFAMVFCATILFSQFAVAGRNDLVAMHFGGVGVGMALSAVLLMGLGLFAAHWTTGWYAAAALALVGSIVAVTLVRADPIRSGDIKEPPLVWTRRLTTIVLAYGLFGCGYIVTATFLVAIIRDKAGQSDMEGLVWLATGIAAAASVYVWEPVARRFGLAVSFCIASLVEAFGVVASVLLSAPLGPFVGGVLLGVTFIAVTAFGLQLGGILAPRSRRKALAIMTAAFGTGQIIGPLFAGHLADLSGNYTAGSLIAAGALTLAALLALASRPAPSGTQM